ncbi:hypothetical protein [Escherichia coli]|uniref:hypothetical protein n=1 Tax=Escherichia coli TaxID=562 RepID=UPI00201AEAE8|nr:hypothetical protein [Escherichia coli]
MDDLRGDFHHSEQGRSSCPCHNKNPIFVVFLCCGYSAVAVLVDISVMGITISASCPPASAILRFALISVSYRANFRSLWKLGRINGLGLNGLRGNYQHPEYDGLCFRPLQFEVPENINGLGWFPRCSPLANFENINQLPP